VITLTWEETPRLVKVQWDDITDLAGWYGKAAIEEHWEQAPFRCENVGYLVATDGTGAMYIASRFGQFGDNDTAFGLIERIPKGCITSVINLQETNDRTDGAST